jgi:hypothetical protein
MKKYQLILTGRFPETHELCYQISCDGAILISDCTYADGYRHVAQLMGDKDTFQEIEDTEGSREMSYLEMQQGNHMLSNSNSKIWVEKIPPCATIKFQI